MSAPVSEMYIGEILMQTKEFPAKYWDVVTTSKGIHFIFFMKISLFEVLLMLSAWLLIVFVAIINGVNGFVGLSFLFLISSIYLLDRYRIHATWKRLSEMTLMEKMFSSERNIHVRREDIRRILIERNAVKIFTKKTTYRLRYFMKKNRFYKKGIDPFQIQIEKKENKEIDIATFGV